MPGPSYQVHPHVTGRGPYNWIDVGAVLVLIGAAVIVLVRLVEFCLDSRKRDQPNRIISTSKRLNAASKKPATIAERMNFRKSAQGPDRPTGKNEDEELKLLQMELEEVEKDILKMESMIEEEISAPAKPATRPNGALQNDVAPTRAQSQLTSVVKARVSGVENTALALAEEFLSSRYADAYLRHRGTKRTDGSWADPQ